MSRAMWTIAGPVFAAALLGRGQSGDTAKPGVVPRRIEQAHSQLVGDVKLMAESIRRENNRVYLSGTAEVTKDGVTVRADRIVYHPATGEAEASGNVRVPLFPKTPGRTPTKRLPS